MSTKVSMSFDPDTAELLKQRARQEGKPASQYVAGLVQADARRYREELAAAGYQELAADTAAFAERAVRIAPETWPTWEE